jgi:hypothetical protein
MSKTPIPIEGDTKLFDKVPDTILLTDEHFKLFLERTILSEYAKRALTELTAKQTAAAPAPQSAKSAADHFPAPASNAPYGTAKPQGRGRRREGNGKAETT